MHFPSIGECGGKGATDLAGADLPEDVRLLSDAVLQVGDVSLQPVPVTDDGRPLQRVATLCALPSATRAQNTHEGHPRLVSGGGVRWELLRNCGRRAAR